MSKVLFFWVGPLTRVSFCMHANLSIESILFPLPIDVSALAFPRQSSDQKLNGASLSLICGATSLYSEMLRRGDNVYVQVYPAPT